MSSSYLSHPFDDLLRRSGLSPTKIDMSLERLARMWQPTVLKPGHVYLRQIRDRTGINVVGISRRYRRLLVEIQQLEDEALLWRYHERSRSDCVFSCAGQIPHALGDALPGRALRALIIPTPALGEMTIDSVWHDPDGWLDLKVTPQWRPF